MSRIVNYQSQRIVDLSYVPKGYRSLQLNEFSISKIHDVGVTPTSSGIDVISIGDTGGYFSFLQINLTKAVGGQDMYYATNYQIIITLDDKTFTINVPRIGFTQGTAGYQLTIYPREGCIDKIVDFTKCLSPAAIPNLNSTSIPENAVFTKDNILDIADLGGSKTVTVADNTLVSERIEIFNPYYSLTPFIVFNKNLKVTLKGSYGNCNPYAYVNFVGGAKIA